jgi:hypothetical protein
MKKKSDVFEWIEGFGLVIGGRGVVKLLQAVGATTTTVRVGG